MGETVAAIGITNQRETDGRLGPAHGRAAPPRDRVAGPAHGGTLRRAPRRRPRAADPRSAPASCSTRTSRRRSSRGCCTKAACRVDGDLAFGTVDTWILWRLTGGTDGGVHATDPSNASRTMLFDIGALDWSDELCALFDVPRACLPDVLPSSGRFGMTRAGLRGRARRCR